MDELLDAINAEDSLVPRLGILGIDLSDELKSRLTLRISSGVVVVDAWGAWITTETGLQASNVIHQLNLMPIDKMETLRAAVGKLKTGDPVVLQVERADGLSYLSFEME